jgi:hypothetical protein
MNDIPANPVAGASATAPERQPLFPFARSWKVASGVGAVMVALALLGVALSTTSNAAAPAYWVSLVPIYGLLCLGMASVRAKQEGKPPRPYVLRQLLHWLGIGVALALDFLVRGTGQETGTAAGLNALLLLALGCFLAGIHLEWLFALVGVLLGLALVVVAKADQYLWLIFVVGGLAVAAMFGLQWLLGRMHTRHAAQPTAPAAKLPG